MTSRCRLVAMLLAGALLLACNDPPSKDSSADKDDAGSGPVMDKNIAEAVQSANLGAGSGPGQLDGPPPTGVFAPGQADKTHPAGALVKVELISQGAEPRLNARPTLEVAKGTTIVVEVAKRFQTQLLPALRYTLAVQIEKPKEDDVAASSPAPAPATPRTITFTVKKVESADQGGGVGKEVAELKGARVVATLADDGSLVGDKVELDEKAAQGAGRLLVDSMRELLALFFSPWPDKPVGLGAYWIATDRALVNGMQVVRYRVTKIEEMKGDEMVVSLDLREYAVDGKSLPAAVKVGGNVQVLSFNATGKATWTRKATALLPSQGQVKTPTALQLGENPNDPQRVVPLQIEAAAAIAARPAGKNE